MIFGEIFSASNGIYNVSWGRRNMLSEESSFENKGYCVCYAGVNDGHHSGIVLIVIDRLHLVVIQCDVHG